MNSKNGYYLVHTKQMKDYLVVVSQYYGAHATITRRLVGCGVFGSLGSGAVQMLVSLIVIEFCELRVLSYVY